MKINLAMEPITINDAANVRQSEGQFRLLFLALCAVLIAGFVGTGHAATAAEDARMAQCPEGTYSGPVAGVKRFYQDPYIWFVSREFATRFCMPESYIDNELKGALALAVRIKPESFALCGMWMGRSDQCSVSNSLLIDVYIDNTTVKIPKADPSVEYYSGSTPNSGMLVDVMTERVMRRNKGANTETPGERRPFSPFTTEKISRDRDWTKFFLLHVREGIADQGASFIETFYRSNWSSGIDLITLDAYNLGYGKGTGGFDPLDTNNPVKSHAIGIIQAREDQRIRIPIRPGTGFGYRLPYPNSAIAHIIHLPKKVAEIADAFNNKEGEKFFGDIKRVIKP